MDFGIALAIAFPSFLVGAYFYRWISNKITKFMNPDSNVVIKVKTDITNGVIVLIDRDMDTKFNVQSLANPIYNAFDKPYETCLLIDKVDSNVPIKLILATKGGEVINCEKIVKKLKQHPAGYSAYIAGECYSAGAVLALGAKEIVMGQNSYLGKIDPQKGSSEMINYIEIHNNPDLFKNHDKYAYEIVEAQHCMNHMEQILSLLFGDNENMIMCIRDNFIYSKFPHYKLFDFEECKALGLPVREPQEDELDFIHGFEIVDKKQ